MTDNDDRCLFCGEAILVLELEEYETFHGRKVCMKLDCKRKMSDSPSATPSPVISQPLKKFKQTTLSGLFESISTGEMELNTVLSHEKSPIARALCDHFIRDWRLISRKPTCQRQELSPAIHQQLPCLNHKPLGPLRNSDWTRRRMCLNAMFNNRRSAQKQ
jgi:hypothetical protein